MLDDIIVHSYPSVTDHEKLMTAWKDSHVFHKIKIDPAVASGPLITTVNDLVAVVTYYGLAFLLLIM